MKRPSRSEPPAAETPGTPLLGSPAAGAEDVTTAGAAMRPGHHGRPPAALDPVTAGDTAGPRAGAAEVTVAWAPVAPAPVVTHVDAWPPVPRARADRPVWLHVGTLLDGTSTSPAHDVHLVYDHEAIRFVGEGGRTPPRALVRAGQDRPDLVAPEHTVLPGLVDAHTHLFLEGGELEAGRRAAQLHRSPDELLADARARLERLVRLGLAGVRDAGDRHGVGLALSRLYQRPDRPLMPYLESPGAAIHRRGRYGRFMGDALESHPTAHACVAARVAAGADRIKLIATGVIDFRAGRVTAAPQLTTADVAELVTAAASFERQTFAHASGEDGIEHALAGGVHSIEHGFFLLPDQLARMRDQRTAWVPTFAPVQAQLDHAAAFGWDEDVADNLRRILDQHANSLRRAHELGVPIVAGSDAGSGGVPHGFGLLDELELMERAGLPPLAVIRAATGTGAERLAYREPIGRIRPGYRSRFIVTHHSPLETVAHLRLRRTIVFDGEVLHTGVVEATGM